MSSNVFGTPITDDYIKGLPGAPNDITAAVRAQYAMDYINDGSKNVDAQTYVDNLKSQYGNGITCRVVFYNATGGTLSYVTDHDYHGHIGAAPYPLKLQNGQWGAFLHVHPTGAMVGSSAAAVYGGVNGSGEGRDWMMAWSIPYIGSNHSYTEIRESGHFADANDVWGVISDKMGNSGHETEDSWGGCKSKAIIGESTSPAYTAMFTLEDVKFLT
ncbi:23 kDa jasmonate-induced protein-like [Malania oleifera]|uniref:23 kDa jasmonate-induced protein-like n=1 Tax=Malania oleifera TaxID=397392 RepID=UPI0025AE086E|nr:23 kDa jasmonate-induced protein-like [Malania oleifera]